MKRVWIFLACIAMVSALTACKKPVGQTPYESVGGEDISLVTGDDENTDSPSAETDTPSADNDDEGEGDTAPTDTTSTRSAGTDDNSTDADDGQPTQSGEQEEPNDDGQGDDDDDRPVNGTTKKGQTTTKKGTTTRPAVSSDGGSDNEAVLDWGELMPDTTTTAKVVNGTTAKPTATTVEPGVRSYPKAGDSVHQHLELGEVKINGTSGTMVVKNISKGMESEQTSYLLFACYDKNGKSLGDVRINIGRIHAGEQTDPLPFTIPSGTVTMTFKAFEGEFWTNGFH